MAAVKSIRVPRALTEIYDAVRTVTDAFCRDHLNDEYAGLARRAAAALGRKRPSPLVLEGSGGRGPAASCTRSGRPTSWPTGPPNHTWHWANYAT